MVLRVSDCLLTSETGCATWFFSSFSWSSREPEELANKAYKVGCAVRCHFSEEKHKNHGAAKEALAHYSAQFSSARRGNFCRSGSGVRISGAAGGCASCASVTWTRYIQELSCVSVLDALTPAANVKVQYLANLCDSPCNEAEPAADLVSQVERLLAKFRTKHIVR